MRRVLLGLLVLGMVFSGVSICGAAEQGGGGRGGRGGGAMGGGAMGGGMRGGFGGGMMMARDGFTEAITVLGELNLTPAFTLTKEQKDKIQGIRDQVREAQNKWREEHAADFQKMAEEMRGLRDAGDGAREKFQEMMQKRQQLMATAPKTDDAVKQLKAVLTEEQGKSFDEKMKEREQAGPRMMGGMGGGMGGGAGGGGGRRGN